MIYRTNHMKNYTMIQNEIVKDERLSFEARGLLMMMLTFPDDWKFSTKGLETLTGKSKATILKYIGELKAAGYVTQRKVKDEAGHYGSYEWSVFESAEVQKNITSDRGIKNPRYKNLDHIPINIDKPINISSKEKTKAKEKADKNFKNFDSILEPLAPDLKEIFIEFLKMRKAIKAPMTERALQLAVKKANDLSGGDPEKAKAIVEQSILNSWKGLYPLKDNKAKTAPIYENPFTKLRREEGYE